MKDKFASARFWATIAVVICYAAIVACDVMVVLAFRPDPAVSVSVRDQMFFQPEIHAGFIGAVLFAYFKRQDRKPPEEEAPPRDHAP